MLKALFSVVKCACPRVEQLFFLYFGDRSTAFIAVLYRCAWILVPSFPEQIQDTAGPLSVRHQATTAEKRQEILQSQVDEEIQKLVDAGHGAVSSEFMAGFAVFRGGVRRESEKRRR